MRCLVLYEAGKSGTWLTWFINQHSNFHKYEYKKQHRNLSKQVDIACNGADWYYEKEDYSTNRTRCHNQYSNNKNAFKDCIKVLPNHNLTNFGEHRFTINKSVLRGISFNIDKIIIPILSDIMYDEFLWRWKLLLNEKNSDLTDIEMLRWQNENMNSYEGLDHHFLDIGKLITGCEEEYNSLLTFIEEESIENWKEIVYNYKKFAFGNYKKES